MAAAAQEEQPQWHHMALIEYQQEVDRWMEKGCPRPHEVSASRLCTRWNLHEEQPGHLPGILPGTVFTHKGQLSLVGLHTTQDTRETPDDTLRKAMFSIKKDTLQTIMLCRARPSATAKAVKNAPALVVPFIKGTECGWKPVGGTGAFTVDAPAGAYNQRPLRKLLDCGPAGLLKKAQRECRHVRVVQQIWVKKAVDSTSNSGGGVPRAKVELEPWYVYLGLYQATHEGELKVFEVVDDEGNRTPDLDEAYLAVWLEPVPHKSLTLEQLQVVLKSLTPSTVPGTCPGLVNPAQQQAALQLAKQAITLIQQREQEDHAEPYAPPAPADADAPALTHAAKPAAAPATSPTPTASVDVPAAKPTAAPPTPAATPAAALTPAAPAANAPAKPGVNSTAAAANAGKQQQGDAEGDVPPAKRQATTTLGSTNTPATAKQPSQAALPPARAGQAPAAAPAGSKPGTATAAGGAPWGKKRVKPEDTQAQAAATAMAVAEEAIPDDELQKAEHLQVNKWLARLSRDAHLLVSDLTGRYNDATLPKSISAPLPLPVFAASPVAVVAGGSDAQREELRRHPQLSFRYVSDYEWSEGVLLSVLGLLRRREAALRRATAQPVRPNGTDYGAGDAGGQGDGEQQGGRQASPLPGGGEQDGTAARPAGKEAAAAAAATWWAQGHQRAFCATQVHVDMLVRRVGSASAVLRDSQTLRHVCPFNHFGVFVARQPHMPIAHQCWEGCTEFLDLCHLNQQVLRGPNLPLEVFQLSPGAGGATSEPTACSWGVRCAVDMPKGRFVCCILGELTTPARLGQQDGARLMGQPHLTPLIHVAAMHQWALSQSASGAGLLARATLDEGQAAQLLQGMQAPPSLQRLLEAKPGDVSPECVLVVDQRKAANVSRLIRCSATPNLRLQVVFAGACRSSALYYLALCATRDIAAGEELTQHLYGAELAC